MSRKPPPQEQGGYLVGTRGFEPPTSCTPCKRSTRLNYVPKSVYSYTPYSYKSKQKIITDENRFYFPRMLLSKFIKNRIMDVKKITTLAIAPPIQSQ